MASIRLTPEQDQQLQEARKRAIDSTNMLNKSSQDIREGRIDIFDQIARYSGGTASVMFTFLGVLIGLKNGQEYINGSFIFCNDAICCLYCHIIVFASSYEALWLLSN
jgi:hypothetical protein